MAFMNLSTFTCGRRVSSRVFLLIFGFSTKIVNAAVVPLIASLRNHNEGHRHDFDFVGNTHRESLAGAAERNFNWGLRLKPRTGDASFLGGGGGLGESSPRKVWNLEARTWHLQHSQWDISLKTSTWIRCKVTGTRLTAWALYLLNKNILPLEKLGGLKLPLPL